MFYGILQICYYGGMKTAAKQTRKITKKQTVMIAIAGVIVVLASWWAYVSFMPHPLGDKLEYLGKEDFGGGLFFQDYRPYSEYYYGTDMTPEEVISYFKKSSVVKAPSPAVGEAYFGIRAPTGETIYVTLYDKEIVQTKYPDLHKTNKKYILELPSSKYEAAKASL